MKLNPKKLKKLQDILLGKGDKVPEGWYTLSQLCELFDVSRTPMGNRIARLKKKNPDEIKVQRFLIRIGSGLHSVPHYKFKSLDG